MLFLLVPTFALFLANAEQHTEANKETSNHQDALPTITTVDSQPKPDQNQGQTKQDSPTWYAWLLEIGSPNWLTLVARLTASGIASGSAVIAWHALQKDRPVVMVENVKISGWSDPAKFNSGLVEVSARFRNYGRSHTQIETIIGSARIVDSLPPVRDYSLCADWPIVQTFLDRVKRFVAERCESEIFPLKTAS